MILLRFINDQTLFSLNPHKRFFLEKRVSQTIYTTQKTVNSSSLKGIYFQILRWWLKDIAFITIFWLLVKVTENNNHGNGKTTTLLVNYFRKKLHHRCLTGCLLHFSKSMVVVVVLVVGLLRVRLFGNFDNPKRKNKYPNNLFLQNFILSKYSRRF